MLNVSLLYSRVALCNELLRHDGKLKKKKKKEKVH